LASSRKHEEQIWVKWAQGHGGALVPFVCRKLFADKTCWLVCHLGAFLCASCVPKWVLFQRSSYWC